MELTIYEVRCIFCKRIHRSEFFDEIEEEILACRDRAPDWQKGSLEALENSSSIKPIRPERSAEIAGLCAAPLAAQYAP